MFERCLTRLPEKSTKFISDCLDLSYNSWLITWTWSFCVMLLVTNHVSRMHLCVQHNSSHRHWAALFQGACWYCFCSPNIFQFCKCTSGLKYAQVYVQQCFPSATLDPKYTRRRRSFIFEMLILRPTSWDSSKSLSNLPAYLWNWKKLLCKVEFTLLKSKFFPAKFSFSKIQEKILAGKKILCKEVRSFEIVL